MTKEMCPDSGARKVWGIFYLENANSHRLRTEHFLQSLSDIAIELFLVTGINESTTHVP